jgi:cellulose synthase/poly-beta-1,6-N-acetylglucosamine synthase-like glycosyltransferase
MEATSCRSRSKAENVNRALEELPDKARFVFVMDADHHPNVDHAERAVLTMERYGYDVLQGSCTIRPAGLLSSMIAVEFEDMYNVGHRGRTSLFGIGMFGGSNGCWRRELLCKIKMDPAMLTEDIDSSIRSTLKGALQLLETMGGGNW